MIRKSFFLSTGFSLLLTLGAPSAALCQDPPYSIVPAPSEAGSKSSSYDSALEEYEIGYREYRLGHFPEAEKRFKQALALEPNLIKAHYWLGKLFREVGLLKEAIFHEEEVLRLKKLISDRRTALQFENNEYPALSQIETIREREKLAEEAFQKGKRFLGDGHWDGAIAEFKTATMLYPGKQDYVLMLARILWDREDFQSSARFYSDLLDLRRLPRPSIIEALDRLIISENQAKAIIHLRHLITDFPRDEEYKQRLQTLEAKAGTGIVSMGSVLKRDRSQVVLDFGMEQGLKLADEYTLGLRIFRPGESISHPETGNELGRAPDEICGNILVTKVFKNSCWALIQQEFGHGIKAGDYVEIKSPFRRNGRQNNRAE